MGVYTENLLRARSSGYGGTGVSGGDNTDVYGALLAGGAENLNTKRYDAEQAMSEKRFGLQQKQFDELLAEQNRRYQLDLIDKGYGTSAEINKITGASGLSAPKTNMLNPADLEKTLEIYSGLAPYAGQIAAGRINPLYDVGKTNLYNSLKNQLAQYGVR